MHSSLYPDGNISSGRLNKRRPWGEFVTDRLAGALHVRTARRPEAWNLFLVLLNKGVDETLVRSLMAETHPTMTWPKTVQEALAAGEEYFGPLTDQDEKDLKFLEDEVTGPAGTTNETEHSPSSQTSRAPDTENKYPDASNAKSSPTVPEPKVPIVPSPKPTNPHRPSLEPPKNVSSPKPVNMPKLISPKPKTVSFHNPLFPLSDDGEPDEQDEPLSPLTPEIQVVSTPRRRRPRRGGEPRGRSEGARKERASKSASYQDPQEGSPISPPSRRLSQSTNRPASQSYASQSYASPQTGRSGRPLRMDTDGQTKDNIRREDAMEKDLLLRWHKKLNYREYLRQGYGAYISWWSQSLGLRSSNEQQHLWYMLARHINTTFRQAVMGADIELEHEVNNYMDAYRSPYDMGRRDYNALVNKMSSRYKQKPSLMADLVSTTVAARSERGSAPLYRMSKREFFHRLKKVDTGHLAQHSGQVWRGTHRPLCKGCKITRSDLLTGVAAAPPTEFHLGIKMLQKHGYA